MSSITTASAREHFSEIVNRSSYGKERIVLSRRGKDLAAIIPMEDLKLIEMIENKLDIEEAKEAIKEAKQKGTISLEEFKKEIL
ncbi:prevent-host-death family protein [Rickettsia felis str. Pedreira]|uniref:Antitoxin n=2 Tax=Rickettsia felis TaxID=42862 RepID=A0A0F3MV14_RICFI|nr:type II toxin-antitoxin system Phd/YefM family antitoxin [Rickettsia felis]AAY61630.1 Antitoxin of toxin-antitoxin system Phd [Rickettsia felis URRWXCal2]KHO03656.1 antitoxin [Rickettsia felis]KJV59292.1 prevent-host-death family protein [Rickettsia felis str. Pedreira]MDE8610979.1 type II toxin-antitoxin system Phd/YefM family antitoxin [Rickettsia felis]